MPQAGGLYEPLDPRSLLDQGSPTLGFSPLTNLASEMPCES